MRQIPFSSTDSPLTFEETRTLCFRESLTTIRHWRVLPGFSTVVRKRSRPRRWSNASSRTRARFSHVPSFSTLYSCLLSTRCPLLREVRLLWNLDPFHGTNARRGVRSSIASDDSHRTRKGTSSDRNRKLDIAARLGYSSFGAWRSGSSRSRNGCPLGKRVCTSSCSGSSFHARTGVYHNQYYVGSSVQEGHFDPR